MNKQRGGGFTVNGYLAMLLLAVAVASGAFNWYQHKHRTIEINVALPAMKIVGHTSRITDWDEDSYKTHVFPADTAEANKVCGAFNVVQCWIRI
jgi:hypothetical protein